MARIGLTVVLLIAMTGCASDGNFTLLGYTTRPPFDRSVRTVYVPILGNDTFQRGIEFEITKQIIREIESRSPYKVVSDRDTADTILEGKVLFRGKGVNNINQLGEVRDVNIGLLVEVRWKDLRTGEVLSVPNGLRRPDFIPAAEAPPDPVNVVDPIGGGRVGWVKITPSASYIPELGGTTASGLDAVARQVGRQVVNMMEVWEANCAP